MWERSWNVNYLLQVCERTDMTGIGFYMCGKFADILATEKAFSVNFMLSLIKNAKTKISTLRTE